MNDSQFFMIAEPCRASQDVDLLTVQDPYRPGCFSFRSQPSWLVSKLLEYKTLFC